MGSTTATASGTKMRLAMWATAPRTSMNTRRGTTSLGTFEVLPRIIRV